MSCACKPCSVLQAACALHCLPQAVPPRLCDSSEQCRRTLNAVPARCQRSVARTPLNQGPWCVQHAASERRCRRRHDAAMQVSAPSTTNCRASPRRWLITRQRRLHSRAHNKHRTAAWCLPEPFSMPERCCILHTSTHIGVPHDVMNALRGAAATANAQQQGQGR